MSGTKRRPSRRKDAGKTASCLHLSYTTKPDHLTGRVRVKCDDCLHARAAKTVDEALALMRKA